MENQADDDSVQQAAKRARKVRAQIHEMPKSERLLLCLAASGP